MSVLFKQSQSRSRRLSACGGRATGPSPSSVRGLVRALLLGRGCRESSVTTMHLLLGEGLHQDRKGIVALVLKLPAGRARPARKLCTMRVSSTAKTGGLRLGCASIWTPTGPC